MTLYLRESTAGQEIPLGYFLDSTNGDSEEIALTINNTDIKVWKWGATTLASKNSGGATHISNGIYYAVLDATDTNTVGSLVIFVHVAGALANKVDCEVLDANAWDARYGVDLLQVDTTQIEGVDATDQINAACDVALTDYDGPTNAEMEARTILAASYFDPSLDAVANVTLTATTTAVTNGVIVTTNNDKTGYTLSAAGVQAIWDALTSALTTIGSVGKLLVDNINATISSRSSHSAADAADAAWDEAKVGHVAAGSFGEEVQAHALTTEISSLNDFDPTSDAVANVTLTATTTTNTDMRGTDSAALATVATEARLAELDAANLPTDIADIPTVSEFNARTILAASYFDPALDTVASVTEVAQMAGTIGTLDALDTAQDTQHAATQTDIAAVPTATEAADELLKRDWTSVTGEAARSTLNALRALRNKVAIAGSTLTIYEEDDTTAAWSAAVTEDATADPISEIDPV